METKIKEVQDYFVNKIVKGEYEILESTTNSSLISIDELYKFTLWISNGINHFDIYSFGVNFISLEIPQNLKEAGFAKFNKKNAEILEARTIAEIQKLENKIENLKKSL